MIGSGNGVSLRLGRGVWTGLSSDGGGRRENNGGILPFEAMTLRDNMPYNSTILALSLKRCRGGISRVVGIGWWW